MMMMMTLTEQPYSFLLIVLCSILLTCCHMIHVDSFTCHLHRPPVQQQRRHGRKWPVQVQLVVVPPLCGSINNNNDNKLNYDPLDDGTDDRDDTTIKSVDMLEEETLLRISMTVVLPPSLPTFVPNLNVDDVNRTFQQQDDAIDQVAKFCESFPFAAILPVQPLLYFPTNPDSSPVVVGVGSDTAVNDDMDQTIRRQHRRRRCVEVQFLRKKTPERGSMDGGIRFYILPLVRSNDDEELYCDTPPPPMIELIAKRNSQGQVITKVFAEKLIITNFVALLLGTNSNVVTTDTKSSMLHLSSSLRQPSPILENIVQMQSIYHKWM